MNGVPERISKACITWTAYQNCRFLTAIFRSHSLKKWDFGILISTFQPSVTGDLPDHRSQLLCHAPGSLQIESQTAELASLGFKKQASSDLTYFTSAIPRK